MLLGRGSRCLNDHTHRPLFDVHERAARRSMVFYFGNGSFLIEATHANDRYGVRVLPADALRGEVCLFALVEIVERLRVQLGSRKQVLERKHAGAVSSETSGKLALFVGDEWMLRQT